MTKGIFYIMIGLITTGAQKTLSQDHVLDSGWHHLRNAGEREWSEFPAQAEEHAHFLRFSARPQNSETTLSFRQYDVKGNWRVLLNGQHLGNLVQDEKDQLRYLKIPPAALKEENTLEVISNDTAADDIRVGLFRLHNRPLNKVLSEAHVDFEVVDQGTNERIPCRITVVDRDGILQQVSPADRGPLAIRPGHIYTGNGQALLGLPAGTYTFYATRGFEYGVDSVRAVLSAGDQLRHRFTLRREVPTIGWVSTDTHIHTFTWSRHGDATAAERVLTIAGEGIELPVITDHNVHVDLRPFAVDQAVDRYFTTVTGNEVTTRVGHFNIFPVDGPVIDHRGATWQALARQFGNLQDRAIILNHARDIHLGFRPFDSTLHIASAGQRLDKWELPANAMEVINSGSQQTDQMQLTLDWFGMLNGGKLLTPVGSSDSHDVSRFLVGQARTYVRCNDEDASSINVREALANFIEGNVMVSFGLLAEIEVNDSYGPGELVPGSDEIKIAVRVLGPSWASAQTISLYANGKKVRSADVTNHHGAGIKYSGVWNLTAPPHDLFLVAVVEGEDEKMPFWPIAKPYQPASNDWSPRLLGLSGAVWVDGDRNRRRDTAFDYAKRLWEQSGHNINNLLQSLPLFDESISIQAAGLLRQSGIDLSSPEMVRALRRASPETRAAFQRVMREIPAGTK